MQKGLCYIKKIPEFSVSNFNMEHATQSGQNLQGSFGYI